jgi:hypothetical protein
MWTMPVPSASETSSQGMTRCVTPCCAGSESNGPSYSSPTSSEPRTRFVKVASGLRSTAHQPPSTRPYSASGLTAAATFAGSVHGVVVHTTSASPLRLFSGKRTYSDGCVSSAYELISSCCDSDVPQRGHHSTERWPR